MPSKKPSPHSNFESDQETDAVNMIYDSKTFSVLHLRMLPFEPDAKPLPDAKEILLRHGFEIIDKIRKRQLYLDGGWAHAFQEQIDAWQHKTPLQDEVESTLARYAALAQTAMRLH